MSKRVRVKSKSRAQPESCEVDPRLSKLLGTTPLIPGEDAATFDAVLAAVRADIDPTDTIEEFWVADIAYLRWEIVRFRSAKKNLMTEKAAEILPSFLEELGGEVDDENSDEENSDEENSPEAIAERWAKNDPEAMEFVDTTLSSARLSVDAVRDKALYENLDDFERIEHMMALAEARLITIVRELDRHRAMVVALRRPRPRIEDGAFKVIEPQAAE